MSLAESQPVADAAPVSQNADAVLQDRGSGQLIDTPVSQAGNLNASSPAVTNAGPKPLRGLARLSPDERSAIARKGGLALQASGKAHLYKSDDEARASGRKGGAVTSADREHMRRIGKLGRKARMIKEQNAQDAADIEALHKLHKLNEQGYA